MDEEFEIQRAAPPEIADEEFVISRPVQEAQPAMVDRLRPLTPKRMGEFVEQRVLPSFDENKVREEASRSSREAEARSETKNLSDIGRKALAITGSAANAATLGAFPWAGGLAAKGLGKVGVSGFERYADMPLSEAKKAAERKITSASTLEPGYGLAGTIAGIGAGAKTLPTIAPGASAPVSGALTGTAYGAASGLAQEGDIYDAMKGALIGGAGGAIAAPIIERAASGLTRLFVGGRPVVDRSGNLTTEAMDVAKKAGLSDDTIKAISPQLKQTFEERGLTTAAAREAQFKEFGITPKRGMVSGKSKDLVRERSYGNYSPQAEAAEEAAKRVTGDAIPLRDAIGDAIAAGTTKAAQMRKAYDEAYKVAENVKGSFDKDSITNLGEKIRQSFGARPETMHLYNNELAAKAAADLDSVLGKSISVAPNVNVVHRTFRAVEGGRKILNGYLSSARDNTDRAALRKLIDEYDNRIEQNVMNGAFSGDKSVVNQWRNARKLFSEYQNKFGIRKTGEDAGRLMRSVLDGNKTSDDVGNAMFNFASTGDATMKREAVKTFLQLRRALGPNSPELNAIKNSYIRQVMTPSTKGAEFKPQDFGRVANQIDDMLRGRGSEFTKRIISTEEQKMLARYADVMRMAGKMPHHELEKRLSLWGSAAATAAPLILGGANTSLALIHPALGATLGAIGAIPGAIGLAKNLPAVQRSLANRPPVSTPRNYKFPSVRTGLPVATSAAPDIANTAPGAFEKFEEAQELAPAERPGRKSGGRVIDHESEADRLIELAHKAKNNHSKTTQQFLKHDDNSIAKALEIANKEI